MLTILGIILIAVPLVILGALLVYLLWMVIINNPFQVGLPILCSISMIGGFILLSYNDIITSSSNNWHTTTPTVRHVTQRCPQTHVSRKS